jgi:hypothetical protein
MSAMTAPWLLVLLAGSAAGPTESPAFTVYATGYLTTIVPLPGRVPLNHHAGARYVQAWRSDGSRAMHTTALPLPGSTQPPGDEIEVNDWRNRRVFHASRSVNATSTYPMDPRRAPPSREESPAPESGCLLNGRGEAAFAGPMNFLARDKVLGIDTVIYDVGNGGKIWLAPSLQCRVIKSYSPIYDRENRLTQFTEQEPEKIVIGPPDESLFQPVGDEVKPSEMQRRHARYYGLAVEENLRRHSAEIERQDRAYEEARARR